jgi:hypothetical protein
MEILHTIWTVISIISVIFTAIFFWNLVGNIRKELNLSKDVEKFKQTVKLVYVEQVDGMYRMHDKFTHHYICQAATEEELWDLAKEQLPNMKILTTDIEVKK